MKKVCGVCGGKLEYFGKFKKNGDEVVVWVLMVFLLFVKEYFKFIKNVFGVSISYKDVMKYLL